jgi:hypothetical protein
MKEDEHRKQVCNALAGLIAKREDLEISKVSYPDEEERRDEDVDVLIKHKDGEIVIEHTRIESYPKQTEDWKMFEKLLYPLEKEFEGRLPSGYYELFVELRAVKGAKKAKEIQEALKKWIEQRAPTLTLGPPGIETSLNSVFSNNKENGSIPSHCITEKPGKVPFEVTLCRWPGYNEFDKKLLIVSETPRDLEEKRKQRIIKALDDKCPKLQKAKEKCKNGVSILLLELNDISLGNYHRVGDALESGLVCRKDVPDEIYLIRTETTDWWVWIMKEGERVFQKVTYRQPYVIKQTEIDDLVSYIEKFVD